MKKKINLLLFLLMFGFGFLSPLSSSLAATPTISLELGSENQNSQTGKWAWVIKINTENIPNGTTAFVYLYKEGVQVGPVSNETITNNYAEYHTGSILSSSTSYRITVIISPTRKSFSKITPTGITPEIITPGNGDTNIGSEPIEEGTPLIIEGQQTTSGNSGDSDVYTLLAPIGGFTEAPNSIGEYFNKIFLIVIGLCGLLAVIMIVIGGIQYMGDESIFGKTEAKSQITKAILGLIIALGAYALLNTINPDLLGGEGVNIKQVTAEIVYDRASDTAFMQNLDSYSTSNITIDPSAYNDSTFLGYMAHQQGSAGASAILWSAKKGYTEVPAKNPFTKSDINRNMEGNFNPNSAQQTIGTSVLTPDNFLKYWAIKVTAVKNKTTPAIFPAIETELNKVANETGVGIITLKTICRIESAAGCTKQSSITTINSGGFAGLFQLSNKIYQRNRKTNGVWETHKKANGVLLDAYHNAFAAAKYFKTNLNEINKNMTKINN